MFNRWIFSILYRVCKRHIKSIIKNKTVPDTEEEVTSLLTQGFDEQVAEAILLKNALIELKPEERLIIMLSVSGGYNSREIASITKQPSTTVRSKLSRALKKLKAVLQKDERL
jgi:RNA polymerase sigma-70 factor (ECF subfamily)